MSDTIKKIKCLIKGSSPVGYTAALYAARANMNPVLYQDSKRKSFCILSSSSFNDVVLNFVSNCGIDFS